MLATIQTTLLWLKSTYHVLRIVNSVCQHVQKQQELLNTCFHNFDSQNTYFVFFVITRHHKLGFRRHIVEIIPTSLRELPILFKDFRNPHKKDSKLFCLTCLDLDFGFQTFGAGSRRRFHVESEFEVDFVFFISLPAIWETRKL